MATKLTELQEKILSLSTEERAALAEHIITTLDASDDINAEQEWLDEAEHRYQLYREGKLESKPANKVFEDAFKKLG